MVVMVVLLAVILALSNFTCAVNCSTQPCDKQPPCHQKQHTAICSHVQPDADMTPPVVIAPAVIPVAGMQPPLLPQSAAPPAERIPLTRISLPPPVLRI